MLEYANNIIKLVEAFPNKRSGNHIGNQLLKSGTAPYAHHGEAQAAESNNDFVHKMSMGLKESRESFRWLRLVEKSQMVKNKIEWNQEMIAETEELINIAIESEEIANNFKKQFEVLWRSAKK